MVIRTVIQINIIHLRNNNRFLRKIKFLLNNLKINFANQRTKIKPSTLQNQENVSHLIHYHHINTFLVVNP